MTELSFDEQVPSPQEGVSTRQWLVIFGGLLGGFMAILDIQVINASMKVIQGALSATLEDSSWLMTSYFTAEIVAIPLFGWLSKAFGTGRYALYCIAGFVCASLLCSHAWSLQSMIVFRSMQGFCGGALIPISFRLIIEVLPKEKRPVGMAMFSVVSTFAPAIGPAIGGWLTDNFSWHMIFYINVLPGFISAFLISQGSRFRRIRWNVVLGGDFLGVVSVMLFLGALEVVLEKGSKSNWFSSDLICWLSVISAISLVIFIYDQLTCRHSLINVYMFRDFNFSYALLVFMMLGAAIYGTLFLVPYYLTMVHNYDASQIGPVIVWMGLPQLIILPFIPKLVQHINLKYMIAIGFFGLSMSAFMDCHMSLDFAGEQIKWSLLVRALGQPFIMVPLSLLATANVTHKDSASSAIIINVFRSIGGAFGTAILTTFFISLVHEHAASVQESLSVGSEAYIHFIRHLHQILLDHSSSAGLVDGKMSQVVVSVLSDRIKQQAEIMAFNSLFVIMGCMMLGTSIWVLLSNRDFSLLGRKEESTDES
ncbi:MAG: Colistin resistance protein EmrB [Candidatus Celerinatantimonas neptuna]|nr:MAG: Colistin resistance protein EmrB [Candidatus Celerinatantimonas neptuna]